MDTAATLASSSSFATPASDGRRGIDGDTSALDIEDFLDRRPFGLFQWGILVLCFLVIAADGFDTAAIGYVGPALAAQWGLSKLALGPLFSSALVGATISALVAGPLGDRLGRKRVLLWSVLLFGILSLACAVATSLPQLIVLRFLTGLGLGAAMPNAVTLLSEYSPARHRALLVNAMFCGFTLGSSSGGFTSAWLITDYGWKIIFIIGGVIPIVLALVMIRLPESVRFMANAKRMNGASAAQIRKILERIDPRVRVTAGTFLVGDAVRERSPLSLLFSRQYRWGSALLWLTYFMGLVMYFVLTSWLPTLMQVTGLTMRQAAMMTALLSLGAGVGPLLLGVLMDRMNPYVVVAGGFFLAGCFVWGLGLVVGNAAALPWLVFITGVFLSGALTSMPVLAAASYPTQARASGVAWMLGIGRIGGIVGAAAGGPLLSAGLSVTAILGLLTVPAFIATASLLAKGRLDRSGTVALAAAAG